VDYLCSLYQENLRTGRVYLSSKEAVISIVNGEFEEVKAKLTSGISGQHKKGGSSSGRFYRKREDDIDLFFKRVQQHMKTFSVDHWEIIGEKSTVKRFG
jgi:peptide chain release factor subunit 1